jgi:phenylacetate-coenzyme A ligase PaaK-like adenylate-forming protein
VNLVDTIVAWYKSLKIPQWDRSQIVALQQQRFRKVLKHVAMHSDFYRELYREIDIENCQLQDLPIVTKSAMMDNYDRLVTDKRLKLSEIKSWLSRQNNQGKYYLDEFAPFLTAGSTGESALIVYSRRAMNQLQATIQSRLPLDRQFSVYHQALAAASYLIGAKARLAVLGVPRGYLFGEKVLVTSLFNFVQPLIR